jgi:hypothetical protein
MAVLTQAQVKALFETDDTPTQSDFIDLIDTLESNSAVVSTSVAGTGDVWDDVNANNLIDQTSKQINIIIHNGTFYLFNGGIGTFGLGGTTPTVTTHFVASSAAYEAGKVGVVQSVTVNTNSTAHDATTLAIDFASQDPPLVHLANQTSIVRYADEENYLINTWWLIDADPGTYGLAESTLGANQFIQVGLERFTAPIVTTRIELTQSFPGTSTVEIDFNLTNGIQFNPAFLYIIDHPNGTYLFNWGSPIPKGIYSDWGLSYTPTTSANFILIESKADLTTTIDVTEAALLAGTGTNIDFSTGVNFDIVVDGAGTTALATPYAFTATNLVDGQSGYIKVSRAAVGLQADTHFTFSTDFMLITSGHPIVDGDNFAWYFYEIVAVPSAGDEANPTVFIKTSTGEIDLWA